MTPAEKDKIDELELELRKLKEEELVADEELQKIRARKAMIQSQIAELSDDAFEQRALEQLYEQRQRKKNR